MSKRVLFDAFRAKIKSDTTGQVHPSVHVSMHAISADTKHTELRCLITEREFSPGKNVLKCSREYGQTGQEIMPDNINITLRADSAFERDTEKMAIWLNTDNFKNACVFQSQLQNAESDAEVRCDPKPHDENTDPHFILSKISASDLKKLPFIQSADDARNIYKLHTNEGNLCRLIDYKGHVTCVTASNETANDHLGVFFKVVAI